MKCHQVYAMAYSLQLSSSVQSMNMRKIISHTFHMFSKPVEYTWTMKQRKNFHNFVLRLLTLAKEIKYTTRLESF